MSNRYCLKVVLDVVEIDSIDVVPESVEAGDPELCSNALVFARPISKAACVAVARTVPLVLCAVSTNHTFLNASVSPDTNPISGILKILVTFTKEPILNLVVLALSVSKSLA